MVGLYFCSQHGRFLVLIIMAIHLLKKKRNMYIYLIEILEQIKLSPKKIFFFFLILFRVNSYFSGSHVQVGQFYVIIYKVYNLLI